MKATPLKGLKQRLFTDDVAGRMKGKSQGSIFRGKALGHSEGNSLRNPSWFLKPLAYPLDFEKVIKRGQTENG